jgi:pyruvate dehydrogenase E1 component alpha subunit
MEEGLTKEDCIITAYREHCNHMARGDTPYRIIAEMMGKATGSTKAKGGSMHYYSKKNNFYGGNGIVGAQTAVGTGLAFALKYLNKPYACFALYGDGSSNQGQLFEASNMAGVWKLPIVYVIENNKYGMGTSIERASHHTELHSKFRGFPGLEIDGMNVFAVREAVKFCKEYVIKNGPMFLNIDTYRYQGHSMSDPGVTYRTSEEVAKTRETRDCISKVRNYILENKLASEEEIKNIEKSIKNQLLEDIEKIKKDPVPDDSEVTTDVYVEKDFPYIRGVQHHLSVFNGHKQ